MLKDDKNFKLHMHVVDYKRIISTGTVVKCPDPRHALVEFEDKEQVLTPTRLMIATSGAIARPHLRVGTYH